MQDSLKKALRVFLLFLLFSGEVMGLQHSFKRAFTGAVTSLSTTLAKVQV